jgi:ubiquinone/menaquinone biosynthesis C-methylase UbiE
VNGEDDKPLGELARVTKRGGRLVVVEFKTTAEGADADDPSPPMAHRVSRPVAVERVGMFGFDAERFFDAGPRLYAVVFRKR